MGRAMIIICAGVLVSLGIISMSTADQGKLLTQKTTTYANKIAAKNAAHTGIQIAMQEISKDTSWAEIYDPTNPYGPEVINNAELYISVEYINDDWADNEYFMEDYIRIVSKATIESVLSKDYEAGVTSVYKMAKFSDLVPEFTAALQLPTGYETFNVDGAAHAINGMSEQCENKPPITVNSQATKDDLDDVNLNLDNGEGQIAVDTELNYEPTDELIQRLKNSGNAVTVNTDYGQELGSPDDPGVFFIDGNVTLTGRQSEGYGIMVIQNNAYMDYNDDGNVVDIRGNFEFNGLVIFENAELFDGRGTPTINGSVLVGHTDDSDAIDINIGGNIEINYDCNGEKYAKMAAANLVDQNKYTRIVTYE